MNDGTYRQHLQIAIGQRALVDRFDLKKRAYVGNTSMESEVSLYMANQSLAAPGKLVYDPFTGTGSMLLTASHFGAYAMGSDIDPRPIRGNSECVRGSCMGRADMRDHQRRAHLRRTRSNTGLDRA